jgi:hypothetical protein
VSIAGPAAEVWAPVLPQYGKSSLAELLPSVAATLGLAGTDNTLNLPSAERYVVLLVDGLGELSLLDAGDDAPYLAGLLDGADTLTAPLPSTTATSLTSLGTGLPPGAHGVAGYTTRIPGSDRLLNALDWDPTVDPLRWQPHRTVFDRLAGAGVAASVVNRRRFQGSGLSVASMGGATFIGANTAGERIAAAASAAAAVAPSLTYTYEADLDATGHRQGCDSPAWRHQLRIVDETAARLRAALPRDACLIVTGDHGMVDVPLGSRLDVDTEPDLMDGVELFGGEARFRQLYCAEGAAQDVTACWRERLGADALVLSRSDAITAGWFGDVAAPVYDRLGDVIIACLGETAVLSKGRFPTETRLIGLHGSLTAEEMLVPLLVDAGH